VHAATGGRLATAGLIGIGTPTIRCQPSGTERGANALSDADEHRTELRQLLTRLEKLRHDAPRSLGPRHRNLLHIAQMRVQEALDNLDLPNESRDQ